MKSEPSKTQLRYTLGASFTVVLTIILVVGTYQVLGSKHAATLRPQHTDENPQIRPVDDRTSSMPVVVHSLDAEAAATNQNMACGLTAEDVKNVPEGWTPHIFSNPCIGVAFPTTDKGVAYNAGVSIYGDWDGEMLKLSDNEDVLESKRSLEMMVIEDTVFNGDPTKCSSAGMDGYVFCRSHIVEEWIPSDLGTHVIYRPKPDQIEHQYDRGTVAVAALITKDNRFVTFFLFDRSATLSRQTLTSVLESMTLGKRE